MKQTLFSLLIIGLVLVSSCHKPTTASPSNGGSWTIKGTTSYADSCTFYPGVMASMTAQTPVNTNTINNYSQINIFFGATPVSSRSYTLVPDSVFVNGLNANQAYLTVDINGLLNGLMYNSTTGGVVSVTVSPTGKVAASASNITVQNSGPPYDNTPISFNLMQTN